ncbi:peptide methionine sulfoxide reductase-like [Pocillopora verrucosa]|uniref:peptide methionine sulfoxide reductase-like n=1 Tax=Pocillopora verrucosa TaxID=203993 RepID=UPI002797C15E|nr:peptide methionine sulfoxide reductase-like [Pocillopora verrucosa]
MTGGQYSSVWLKEASGDHTETLELEYDPNCTTYKDLLKIFWKNHNPTAVHKAQYMSAIFYHNEDQKQLAEETREEHQKIVKRKIVTKILPANTFYVAEQYHQKYMLRQHPLLLNSLGLNDEELKKSRVAARLNGYVGGYGSIKSFEAEVDGLKLSNQQIEMVKEIIERRRF